MKVLAAISIVNATPSVSGPRLCDFGLLGGDVKEVGWSRREHHRCDDKSERPSP